jgi:hypothetical protein
MQEPWVILLSLFDWLLNEKRKSSSIWLVRSTVLIGQPENTRTIGFFNILSDYFAFMITYSTIHALHQTAVVADLISLCWEFFWTSSKTTRSHSKAFCATSRVQHRCPKCSASSETSWVEFFLAAFDEVKFDIISQSASSIGLLTYHPKTWQFLGFLRFFSFF